MDTKYDFDAGQDQTFVYVRPVKVQDLPEDVREDVLDQADGLETLYAVHNADGERLALVRDRALAFDLAKQHDMEPVPVH